MSKLLGKLFLEKTNFDKIPPFQLKVKYLKSTDSFSFFGLRVSLFEFKDVPGIDAFHITLSRSVICDLIDADKNKSLVYQWSFGYKTPQKTSDLNSLCVNELNSLSSPIPRDVLLDFAAWQYLFKISRDSLSQASLLWKRKKWNRLSSPNQVWLDIPLRSHSKVPGSGRKLNSPKSWPFPGESLQQVIVRCERNKALAVQKNFLPWFIDASKELALALNQPFDLNSCLSSWRVLSYR